MVNIGLARRSGKRLLDAIRENGRTVASECRSAGFEFFDSGDFLRHDFRQEWLAEQAVVARQPLVIGGSKKVLKTSIAIDLAVSLASGTPFLGRFDVPRAVPVGVMSGESGGATLKETFRRICRSKEIDRPGDLPINWSLQVPSLSDPIQLEAIADEIRRARLQVLMIDPLYLALLRGGTDAQASNLYEIGPLLMDVSQTCIQEGATPVIIHHFRKGQSHALRGGGYQPPELDDLAFAGISEFARQWMLIGRRQQYDPETGNHELWLNIGGSAGQGSTWALDVNEGRLESDFSGRHWHVEIRSQGQQLERNRWGRETEKREQADRKDVEDIERILGALRLNPEGLTGNQLAKEAGMGKPRLNSLLPQLLALQRIRRVELTIHCGPSKRKSEGFQLNAQGQVDDDSQDPVSTQ